MKIISKIDSYLSLVKFSHSVFAMPFALIGFFVASRTDQFHPLDLEKLTLIVLCMITARNAAMAFNRWADREIDKKNQRTAGREIPSGTVSPQSALIFVTINLIVDLLYEGGLDWMRYSISDTAEYGDLTRGPRVIGPESKAAMKEILREIQDGEFAREFIEENQTGRVTMRMKRLHAAEAEHSQAVERWMDLDARK